MGFGVSQSPRGSNPTHSKHILIQIILKDPLIFSDIRLIKDLMMSGCNSYRVFRFP